MNADFYSLAFGFWRLLSEERADLPGGVALGNIGTPLLLSNAAWYPTASDVDALADWYVARAIKPALIVPALRDEALERALQNSSFMLERGFSFTPLEPVERNTTDEIVEQVSWAQSRALGEVLAQHYGMPEYGIALGKTLAEAMQDNPNVLSFVAYDDAPVSAMIAFETPDLLAAMLLGGRRDSLEHRLITEAEGRQAGAWVLEPLEKGVTVKDVRTLERWSIR